VITVTPGTSWEPGQTYHLTLADRGLQADDGALLAGPLSYSFTASALPPQTPLPPPQASPADSSSNVPFQGTTVQLTWKLPLAHAADGTPLGTFGLRDAAGKAIAASAMLVPGSNDQVLLISASVNLRPETVYSVVATGAQIGAGAAGAGQPLPDLPETRFTTLPFGLAALVDQGVAPPLLLKGASLDPAALFDGSLHASFNDPAAGVDTSSVTLAEAGGQPFPHAQVVQGADASDWRLRLDPRDESIKYGQRYRIHFDQSITDAAASGHSLRVFPCSVSDCSDDEYLTTSAWAPLIATPVDPSQISSGGTSRGLLFELAFPHPFDPATVDLAHAFYLLPRPRAADGTFGPPDLTKLLVPTCTLRGGQTIRCRLPDGTALVANALYTYGATFGGSPPGATAATSAVAAAAQLLVGTPPVAVPVDQGPSSSFSGTVSASFETPCP
jgi:hypothetical protein